MASLKRAMTSLILRRAERTQEVLQRVYVAYSCLRLQLASRGDLDGE